MDLCREAGTSKIHLRDVNVRDEPALFAIRNDAALQELLLAHPTPNSMDEVRAWIKRRHNPPTSIFAVIADSRDDVFRGFVQLTEISTHDGVAQLGICVGQQYRGNGTGRAALQAVERFCLEIKLMKLILYVRADNRIARQLYDTNGFREVGILFKHFQAEDRRYDVVLFEKLLAH